MAGDADSASVPWRSPTFHVVVASSLMGVMGVSLVSPVLPDLRPVFGISDAEVGLVITAYTLPGIFLTPFVGLAADRLGRRRVIVPLLFVFGIAGSGVLLADSFSQLLALRFVQGIGASALIALAVTLIGDAYGGERRDAAMGVNASAIAAGAAFYPALGGAFAAIHWSAPFAFFGVGVLVGVFAAIALPESATTRDVSIRDYLGRMYAVVRLPAALAVFVTVFAVFFLFYGTVLTVLPLLLSDEYGLGASRIGPLIAGEAVASAAVSSQYGRVARRFGPGELVALGAVAYGLALLGVWAAPSALLVGVSLLLFGVGFGVVMPSIDLVAVKLVSGELRAGMMGMRTSTLRLGQTLGPIAYTAAAATLFSTPIAGYRALILVSGTITATVGVGAFLALRR